MSGKSGTGKVGNRTESGSLVQAVLATHWPPVQTGHQQANLGVGITWLHHRDPLAWAATSGVEPLGWSARNTFRKSSRNWDFFNLHHLSGIKSYLTQVETTI